MQETPLMPQMKVFSSPRLVNSLTQICNRLKLLLSRHIYVSFVFIQTGEFSWRSSKRWPTAGWHAYPGGEQPQLAGNDAHRGCTRAAGCGRLSQHAGVRWLRSTKGDLRGGKRSPAAKLWKKAVLFLLFLVIVLWKTF